MKRSRALEKSHLRQTRNSFLLHHRFFLLSVQEKKKEKWFCVCFHVEKKREVGRRKKLSRTFNKHAKFTLINFLKLIADHVRHCWVEVEVKEAGISSAHCLWCV